MVFPPQVSMMAGLATVKCTANFDGGNVIVVSNLDSYNPITFTIDGLFKYEDYTLVDQFFNLECEGLQNPKTTEPTSSFSLTFYDRYGCGLERINTGVILYMFGLPSFQSIEVLSDVPYNGQIANFEVKITSTIIMATGYSFYITFPPEIKLQQNIVCEGGLLTSGAVCTTLVENGLKVLLTFTDSPVAATIPFSFIMKSMKNPISTKPTSPFSVISATN